MKAGSLSIFKSSSLGVLLSILSGCATITEGTSQQITFLNVPESTCEVQDSKVTPESNVKTVQKSKNDLVVHCKDFQTIVPSSVSKKAVVGALLLDGGIVDALTGAMWYYPSIVDLFKPSEIHSQEGE